MHKMPLKKGSLGGGGGDEDNMHKMPLKKGSLGGGGGGMRTTCTRCR